jgi:hypothetical protein
MFNYCSPCTREYPGLYNLRKGDKSSLLNFISNIEMQQSEKGRQIFFANSLYQTFQLCISRHPELQDLLAVVPKIITGSHQKTITEISACIISHLFVVQNTLQSYLLNVYVI